MPNNWAYAGFIRLILPNAKIIDARRHPLDCGFSNFKQHFARGQAFSYDLDAYRPLLFATMSRLMAHLDAVQPGKIHRVIHERLVDDPEARDPRACSTIAGSPGRTPAFASTKRSARCAPPAASRSASRSAGQASTSGSRSNRGSARSRTALGPVLDALG